MTWPRAGGYFGLFLVLTAYYVVTEPRSGADAPQLPARRPFIAVSGTEVQDVTVEHGALSVRATRDAGRWRIVSPEHASAPSDLIAALVDQLTQIPDVEVVDEQGENAAQFGLDAPQARLTLRLADGRTIGVHLGMRNPAQTAVYGRLEGESRIVLLGLNVLYYHELIMQAVGGSSG